MFPAAVAMVTLPPVALYMLWIVPGNGTGLARVNVYPAAPDSKIVALSSTYVNVVPAVIEIVVCWVLKRAICYLSRLNYAVDVSIP